MRRRSATGLDADRPGRAHRPRPSQSPLDVSPATWLTAPSTEFAALHSALALAVAGDADGLATLRGYAQAHPRPVYREASAPLCTGLAAVLEGRWASAAAILADLLPLLPRVGGSAAQRDVVEETLLYALIRDDQHERAARLLTTRLDRRPSPLDRRRLRRLRPSTGPTA